jgi:hypothetical protein
MHILREMEAEFHILAGLTGQIGRISPIDFELG